MSTTLYLFVFLMFSVVAFENGDLLKIIVGRQRFYMQYLNKVHQVSELWKKQPKDPRELYAMDKYRYGAGHEVCGVSMTFITSILFILGFICVEVITKRCLLSDYKQYEKSEDNHGSEFHQLLKELHLGEIQEIMTYPSSLKSYFKQRLEDRIEQNHLMQYEWVRYESFKNFPSTSPARPTRLASAGFYYAGYQDTVKCFACNLEVNGWVPDNVPQDVHRRRSPHCPFMNGGITGNISIHDQYEGENNRPLFESNGLDTDTDIRRSIDDPRHRETELDEIRNKTIQDSRLDRYVANNESMAGVITQHDALIDRDSALHELNTEQDGVYKEENDKLAQRITCKICLDRTCNVVFMPCGHVVSCDACAAMLRKCAVCRSPIKGRVRTNLL